jgi:hypothetical protein
VLQLCEKLLESKPAPKGADEFWIKATMAEAYAGLGDEPKGEDLMNAARTVDMSVLSLESAQQSGANRDRIPVPNWMIETTGQQRARLRELLAKSPLDRIKQKIPT